MKYSQKKADNENGNFWFAKVDIDVIKDTELSVTARLIYAVLCTFANTEEERGCWPSNSKVARAAGVSKSTVIRAYHELESRGVITRAARFEDGQRTSSYTYITGHDAPCYNTSPVVARATPPRSCTHDTYPVSPMTYRTRTIEREPKYIRRSWRRKVKPKGRTCSQNRKLPPGLTEAGLAEAETAQIAALTAKFREEAAAYGF